MKFWRYTMRFDSQPNVRTPGKAVRGALVMHAGGLGCLQPWPSLGDPELEDEIAALLGGSPTEMGRACLRCCEIDGHARRDGLSLFDGLQIPPSHVLLDQGTDEELAAARVAGVVKVKGAPDFSKFAHIAVRIDFNSVLDADSFRRWVASLTEEERGQIDFVEDPVPYDPELWETLSSESGLRFALDRGPGDATRGFAVRTWKPACVPEVPSGVEFCITHNMDHLIGRRYAAYQAARFDGVLVACGLGDIGRPDGAGLGCDELLNELAWENR